MNFWKPDLRLCHLMILLFSFQMSPCHAAVSTGKTNYLSLNSQDKWVTPKEFREILPGDITNWLNMIKIGVGIVETIETLILQFFHDKPLDEKEMLHMFEYITSRLEQIEQRTGRIEEAVRDLAKGLPSLLEWVITLNALEQNMMPINNLYNRFIHYQKLREKLEKRTLLDFANNVVSHSTTSVQSLMDNIHSIAAPNGSPHPDFRSTTKYEEDANNRVTEQFSIITQKVVDSNGEKYKNRTVNTHKSGDPVLRDSIFQLIKNVIENYKFKLDQSPQQLIFGLYNFIILTLARGYGMINFSYQILKLNKQGNFTVELQLAKEIYQNHSTEILKNAITVMNQISNAYRTYDPHDHVEGKTFEMVTQLLQGYVENEVDLNDVGTCGYDCPHYSRTTVKGCYLPETEYCGKDQHRCKGNVYNCRFFGSYYGFFGSYSSVCSSRLPYRRYDWIDYGGSLKFGEGSQDTCQSITRADSWLRGFYQCSFCFCLCDDPDSSTSDRFISLKTVISEFAEGMIVTGVKLIKESRVIHIQVQQGKALPRGQVDSSTVHWMNVKPISVDTTKFVENVDYVKLNYTTRQIDLDHLTAPMDHVVTGIKFRLVGSHVSLQVLVTPINFTTGILVSNESSWISSNTTKEFPRSEVILHSPDDPRKAKLESVVDSVSNMFVTLQPTDAKADVSQLTVPFFDAQPVAVVSPTWLEGIQLYHRGASGYGGFLGFSIFNYIITHHLEEEVNRASNPQSEVSN